MGSRTFAAAPGGGVDPHAAKFGLQLVTVPSGAVGNRFATASGLAVYVLTYTARPITLTHLGCWVSIAASGDTGANTMGVYDTAGTRLGVTAEMDLTAVGWREAALTATVNLTPGAYYLHYLSHYSTPPELAASLAPFDRLAVNGVRPTIFHTGQATSPASVTYGDLTTNSAEYFLGAR